MEGKSRMNATPVVADRKRMVSMRMAVVMINRKFDRVIKRMREACLTGEQTTTSVLGRSGRKFTQEVSSSTLWRGHIDVTWTAADRGCGREISTADIKVPT